MKIRIGHVSNSSSTSFRVQFVLLTDKQKKMLFSIGDMKKTKAKLQKMLGGPTTYNFKTSKNDYPRNDEYHYIY